MTQGHGLETSNYQWEPQPGGAAWVDARLSEFRAANPVLASFCSLLLAETGTRLSDWVDHLVLRDPQGLEAAGYHRHAEDDYRNSQALLPDVRRGDRDQVFLRVDNVIDFSAANLHRFSCQIAGGSADSWRTAIVKADATMDFGVVERLGCRTPQEAVPIPPMQIQQVREQLRLRPRQFQDPSAAFAATAEIVSAAASQIGINAACDMFFEAERCYWQSRNRAARVQYMRQQSLGLGWGNHDHHTYRSSRPAFYQLIGLLEMLGCECRERFYAGAEAGWGAQVLEQPVCGIVVFADVDLSADEIAGDIAHDPLPRRDSVGTIGLWCHLHGEAVFEAGMHHLECRFAFEAAQRQLQPFGIRSMPPFTDFPHLRQCFTEGEVWSVRQERIRAAADNGWISQDQADRFAESGVVGSHLEILERNQGYRGFNQTGINDIIRKTDPRVLTQA